MGTPIFSHGGIVCTGETYKNAVKMTFAKGAALKDPSRLFNASLDGNVRRAIDIHEGDKLDEAALKDLIRAAVALNRQGQEQTEAPASEQQAGRLDLSSAPALHFLSSVDRRNGRSCERKQAGTCQNSCSPPRAASRCSG